MKTTSILKGIGFFLLFAFSCKTTNSSVSTVTNENVKSIFFSSNEANVLILEPSTRAENPIFIYISKPQNPGPGSDPYPNCTKCVGKDSEFSKCLQRGQLLVTCLDKLSDCLDKNCPKQGRISIYGSAGAIDISDIKNIVEKW